MYEIKKIIDGDNRTLTDKYGDLVNFFGYSDSYITKLFSRNPNWLPLKPVLESMTDTERILEGTLPPGTTWVTLPRGTTFIDQDVLPGTVSVGFLEYHGHEFPKVPVWVKGNRPVFVRMILNGGYLERKKTTINGSQL